jgi:LPXTG-motif cell wall-anchored protein
VKDTETHTVYLYSFGVDLIKVAGSNEGARLAGAGFRITGTKVNTVVTKSETYAPSTYKSGTTAADTTYYLKKTDGAFIVYNAGSTIESTVPLENVKYAYTGTSETVNTADDSQFTKSITGGYYKLKGSSQFVEIDKADASANYEQDYMLYTMTASNVVVDTTKTENQDWVAYVGNNGKLELDGLGEGTYYIDEIVTPAGYNSLNDRIVLTVSFNIPASGSTKGTWSYSAKMEKAGTVLNTSGTEFRIVNNKGSELPTTGGMGTTLFYVLGTVLVLGAGVLLITKKRMKNA